MSSSSRTLRKQLILRAKSLGFDAVGIVSASDVEDKEKELFHSFSSGHMASMSWMPRTVERRSHPNNLWPQVQSIIMLGMNYGPQNNPLEELQDKHSGVLSVYARNRDYHQIIKGKLKHLGQWLVSETGGDIKVFVDTAPVMEKPLAVKAGLGWQGKHSNLVSRQWGSWLFLGSIFISVKLEADEQEQDHCGSCRRCVDICPTNAFAAPYQLDARRCISYLTIENKGIIPVSFRKKIGNRIYGCDDCLAVCPWNRFAKEAHEQKLIAREELNQPSLTTLLDLDETGFKSLFVGSAVRRIGYECFMRNCLIAAGNAASQQYIDQIIYYLSDKRLLIRGMAVWALRQTSHIIFEQKRGYHSPSENNSAVLAEWNRVERMENYPFL